MKLSDWPGFRIVLLAIYWVIAVYIVSLWRHYWNLSQIGDDAVAPVSWSFGGPTLLAFGPPLVVGVAWALIRRRLKKTR